LTQCIWDEYEKLSLTMGAEVSSHPGKKDYLPVFCAINHAQLIMKNAKFMSDGNFPESSPLLDAFTSALHSTQMLVLLSGTAFDFKAFPEPSTSKMLKVKNYSLISSIGAFEDPKSQARYIKYYVPACWHDPRWRAFLKRAWLWLHGR
jgi:hypothetical protein